MINIYEYVNFLANHMLTQRQFLLLCIVREADEELLNSYGKIYDIPKGESVIGDVELDDLIERGYLIETGESGSLQDFKLGSCFTNLFAAFDNADEFWDLYPSFTVINKKRIPLSLMDKIEFRKLYLERINFSLKEHKTVIEDLKYGIANDLIVGKIENFVRSEQWTRLRTERLKENDNEEISTDSEKLFT